MAENYGWIEIVIFAGIALGFGFWQLISINREIARDKAAKEAAKEAAKQAATKSEPDSAASPGHAEGQHHLDNG